MRTKFEKKHFQVLTDSKVRGFVIPLILIIILILGLIMMALQSSATRQAFQTDRVYQSQVAKNLADAGIDYAIEYLNKFLEDGGRDRLLEMMLKDKKGKPPLMNVQVTPDTPLGKLLAEHTTKFFKWRAQITIEFLDTEGLYPENAYETGIDPWERRGKLRISSEVSSSTLRRKVVIVREFKLVNLLPPLLSKFTLYVPRVTDPNMYNRLVVSIKGVPTQGLSYQPLVLRNHSLEDVASNQSDYTRRGWVFLNGNPRMNLLLHLSAGAGPYGEYFQFFDLYRTSSTVPTFISKSPAGLKLPPDKAFIQFVPWGFFDDIYRDPPDLLLKYRKQNRPYASSMLQIYGNNSVPSRTRVLGNVWRSFPVFTVLTIPELQFRDYMNSLDLADWNARKNGDAMSDPDRDRLISTVLPFTMNYGVNYPVSINAFTDYASYARSMSRIFDEPYPCAYDYMQYNGYFPPSDAPGFKPELPEDDYLLRSHNNLELRFADGEMHFSGKLSEFSPAAAFNCKATAEEKDVETFMRKYYSNGKLELKGIVKIARGSLKFERPLKVASGGIIYVMDGDIFLSGVENNSGEPLTFFTTGNLILGSGMQYENVILAALGPTSQLKMDGPMGRLELTGSLAVTELPAESISGGGNIKYKTEYDPSGKDYKKYYRIFFADRFLEWDVE